MNIIWLQDFVAVAKSYSFSVAAENLFSSQANVSKHIRLLEKEIGLTLFDRNTRSVKMTPAGEKLLISAEKIIKEYEILLSTANKCRVMNTSVLQIATVPIMHMYEFQNFLLDFQKKYPSVILEVVESDMHSVINNLSRSSSSVGIIRECALGILPNPSDWYVYPFVKDELGILCSRQSAFASADSINIMDCLNDFLVVLSSGYEEYRLLLDQMHIPLEFYHPRLRFSSYISLLEYISNGLGVSITTRRLASNLLSTRPNVIWRPFEERCRFSLIIVQRKAMVTNSSAQLVQELAALSEKVVDSTAFIETT